MAIGLPAIGDSLSEIASGQLHQLDARTFESVYELRRSREYIYKM